MTLATKAELDAVMHQSFALEPVANAHTGEQLHGTLLEHAGANTLFNVLAGVHLENDGIDAFQMQEVRKNESGGTGSDDSNLCAFSHRLADSSKLVCLDSKVFR